MYECNILVLSIFQVTGKEEPHAPNLPLTVKCYVVTHFLLVLWIYHYLFEYKMVSISHIWKASFVMS